MLARMNFVVLNSGGRYLYFTDLHYHIEKKILWGLVENGLWDFKAHILENGLVEIYVKDEYVGIDHSDRVTICKIPRSQRKNYNSAISYADDEFNVDRQIDTLKDLVYKWEHDQN